MRELGSLCAQPPERDWLSPDGMAAGDGRRLRPRDLLLHGDRQGSDSPWGVAAGLPPQSALRAAPGVDALRELRRPARRHGGGPGRAADCGDRPCQRAESRARRATTVRNPGCRMAGQAAQSVDAPGAAKAFRDAVGKIPVEVAQPGSACPERRDDRQVRRRGAPGRFLSAPRTKYARPGQPCPWTWRVRKLLAGSP